MKKSIVVLIICVIMLNGCFYQPELRPNPDVEEVWICDAPYAKLYWDNIGQHGKIIIDENIFDVVFETTAGPQLMVYDKEGKSEEENYYNNDYLLFRGHTTYQEEAAIVKVEKDFKNIFNGELPTLEFKRYNKEEYLKSKEE